MDKTCNDCDYLNAKDKPCKWCRNKNLYNPKNFKITYINLITNKNIGGMNMYRLPLLNLTRYVATEQMSKVLEETSELYDAANLGDVDQICTECLDVIQSTVGMLMMIVPNREDLTKQILRHELKLKSREAQGKVQISGWLNIYHQDGY